MNEPSRFESVSRRALLRRSLGLGALVALPGLACGSDDAATFANANANANANATTTTAAAGTGTGDTSPGDTSPSTTAAASTATPGAAFPSGAELVVKFTFAIAGDGFGPARNPYIAVWVEDTSGNLVQTVSAWFLQDQKGARYLHELRRWYEAGGSQTVTSSVSGPTRVAGDYSVMWDGKGLDGSAVAQGDYVLCIEGAREHGPYELITAPITIGTTAFSNKLTANGELTDASLKYTV